MNTLYSAHLVNVNAQTAGLPAFVGVFETEEQANNAAEALMLVQELEGYAVEVNRVTVGLTHLDWLPA